MYAVILSGGKQYRVQEGDTLKVATLLAEVDATVAFDKVLLVGEGDSIKMGRPYLENVSINATVLGHGRDKKIHIIKFRRRKHHEKWQGHRQNYTLVKIHKIEA